MDYVQLLMISQVIRGTNGDWNAKKGPLSHHKMKCLFLDYVQLLIIGWVIWAMKVNWNVTKGPLSHRTLKCLVLDYVQFLMISWMIGAIKFEWNVKAGPLYYHKMKCSILDYVQLLMIGQAGQWTWTPSGTPLQPKNEMLIFRLRSTSDEWPDWSMDSNPIHHPSPAKKRKCLFLDYNQLLMISRAGWWTQTPSATPLQPKQ